jgi:hypothetical protein
MDILLQQRCDLDDLVMKIINAIDPEKRARKLSNRNALLEIDYAMRSGVSWRQLRPRTKKVTYKCVQKRFSIWVHLGVWWLM